MPIITQVRFAHENGALADTLERCPDLTVSVVREAGTDPERDLYFLRMDAPPETDVEAVLRSDTTVCDVEPMPGFETQEICGVEFAPETELLSPVVTSEDGFVLSARSARTDDGLRGWHERWLLPDREALHSIWQHASDEGFVFEVLEFRKQGGADIEYSGPAKLTDQQREALVTAYQRGYFVEPRETSLEELAEALELSPTAVAGRLRRGMKSLILMTLAADDPDGSIEPPDTSR